MARALRRIVLASLVADAVYILAYYVLPKSFGYSHLVITVTIALLVAVGALWLAVLVTALVAAGRRRDVRWIAAFVTSAVIGITCAAILYFVDAIMEFLGVAFNILARGDTYLAFALLVFLIFVVCPLPVPVAALRYAGVLETEVQAGDT
jgi:hypothetical protein